MKIFSVAQIREWDRYTMEHEPVASIDLMNRAAGAFTRWFMRRYPDTTRSIVIYAGAGNNGGDGLAVARMLDQAQYRTKVVVCRFGSTESDDFRQQLTAIPKLSPAYPVTAESFAMLQQDKRLAPLPGELIIDALFGSGLNRPLAGDYAGLVDFLNGLGNEIVSIDIPSGMFADRSSTGNPCVRATRTFSFQSPKLAFLLPENEQFVGEWEIGDIGLSGDYERQTETPFHYIDLEAARQWLRPRTKFSHKGSFGHAMLIAGGWGKMGAAVLAARACLRSGVGLLTIHTPRSGNLVLQTAVPEAMASLDKRAKIWSETPDLSAYDAIGAGPGIGKAPETAGALEQLLQGSNAPLVLDADALNILAEHPAWLKKLQPFTVITPHPGEFKRLFGDSFNGFERIDLLRRKAQTLNLVIVLKGAHTAIAGPDGSCWFNSTGNPGMATGGSGDVLTGLIAGLLAQGYPPFDAARLGVYIHGLAGDLAALEDSQEALTAGALVQFLGKAWLQLHGIGRSDK